MPNRPEGKIRVGCFPPLYFAIHSLIPFSSVLNSWNYRENAKKNNPVYSEYIQNRSAKQLRQLGLLEIGRIIVGLGTGIITQDPLLGAAIYWFTGIGENVYGVLNHTSTVLKISRARR